ncbi:U-box domain-containing protein 33 [Mercurialis annua]|uniref:U-box domain-containing protein 33 n=1 Tax=Mercurialis annua TaxID=3986 RepID=UPI00215E49F0|nr:U-box domain-containing protein 33 [Mercurialis annua]
MSDWITEVEVEEEEDDEEEERSYRRNHYYHYASSSSEIEEENSNDSNRERKVMESIKEEPFEEISVISFGSKGEDCVYVAVGKSESSMDAVSWTLRNLIKNNESTILYLIHVYPPTHFIPSPLGKLPKDQVRPEQVEIFMAQERGKRRQLLQKFINLCSSSSSSKVKVDNLVIESDNVAKAILDLIPILNIKKLVLGTTKSGLRKSRTGKGSGTADQILRTANASECCDIKVICEGQEVMEQMTRTSSSLSQSPSFGDPVGDVEGNSKSVQSEDQSNNNDPFCMCFKSPRVE